MNSKTSEELEREAEMARAHVAETAEAIRSKMTPGQMIDEFTGMFKGGDGEAAFSNLKGQIRDNPLPLVLVGTGLAWLMLGQGSSQSPVGASASRSPRFADNGGKSFYGMNDESREEGGGESVIDTVRDTASEAMSKARDVLGNAKDALGSAGSRATSTGTHFKDQAAAMADRSKGAAVEVFDREPLLLAALGLALGTGIGAMLPNTELEDEHLGNVASKARAKAEDLLDRGVAEAKEVAAGAYETLKEQADQQAGGEGTVVEKVANAVKSTAKRTEKLARDKIKRET